jgi:hypothetical protein
VATFREFLDILKTETEKAVRAEWQDCKEAALRDGGAFVEKTKADLERWTGLLASGALSREDFEWLLQGKKDLAELEALRQAGLAQARLDRFRDAILGVVARTALRVFVQV